MQKFSSIKETDGKSRKRIESYFLQRKEQPVFSRPFFQPKLSINQPNDVYEQEADAVADRVMRMSDGESIRQPFFPAVTRVQRKCAHCEEEERQQVQRQESNHSETATDAQLDAYVSGLSGGEPLSKEVRGFFEPRMGHDFSEVRVHQDAGAAKSARSINALAYTTGSHIVFNSGQFSPTTENGKRLLGHELTHVVQQQTNHVQATTIQRAMMCSKRLEAFLGRFGINHAYIDDTGRDDCLGSGMVGNYAIQTLVSGNFLRGCAAKTDRSTDPQSYTPNKKPCHPKSGVTDLSQCLRDAYNSYADPSVYANPSGPNSNTFAATLASACCEDASSSGLGIVPGWGHSPAPPCVQIAENQQCEPQYLGGGAFLGEDCIVRQGAGPKY